MNLRHLHFLALIPSILFFAAPVAASTFKEGIYGHREKGGGTVIELKDGKYRYWGATDILNGPHPKYPLKGKYSVEGENVILKSNPLQVYVYRVINGNDILWDVDGSRVWDAKKEVTGRVLLRFVPANSIDPWASCPQGADIEKVLRVDNKP